MFKRFSLLAVLVGLALAGCQTADVDATIRKNLPQICRAASTAHAGFQGVAAAGAVKPRTIAREQAAWQALEPLCVAPETATTGDVLVAAASAYVTITAALRDAEAR